jgi:endoglucanase
LYARALSRIRLTNPRRIVIAGGAIGNTVASLATFELPDDPYIVPEFHTYGPVQFTHQGASWVKPALPTPYAFEPMIALPGINAQRTALLAYMRRTGRVPVGLEFGAIRFAPRADRVAYYRTISAMIASAGMYSCAWSDPAFPLQTGGVWDKELIAAIATPQ